MTKEAVRKATLDELRDYIAECRGWKRESGRWYGDAGWPNHGYEEHPVPATLDAAAGALPEGWWVTLRINQHGVTLATLFHEDAVYEIAADTEALARFRCAALAWGRVRKEKSRATT